MFFADLDHLVAGLPRRREEVYGTMGRVDRHRYDREPLVFLLGSVPRRAPMIAHNALHGVAVGMVAGERPQFPGHSGTGGVAGGMHQAGDSRANGPA